MNKFKISLQDGLDEVGELLKKEGHEVMHFGEDGLHADITIITGVDSEYEEINSTELISNGPNQSMLVINATRMSTDEILQRVNNLKK